MEFCEKLIRLRKTHHMTQDDLAQALHVSRQAVYKWECGQSYPEALKLVALKELFGISIDNLLDPQFEVELPPRMKKRRGTEALEKIKAENAASAPTFTPEPPKETEPVALAEEQPKEEPAIKTPSTATPKKEDTVTYGPPVIPPIVPSPSKAAAPLREPEKDEKAEKKGFFSRLFGRK